MTTSHKVFFGSVAAVSLLAVGTVAFAQSSATSSSSNATLDPVACSAALDTQNAAMGPAMDKLNAAKKADFQTKVTALKAALALTDVTQRDTAVQAAEQAFRQAEMSAMKQFQTDTKAGMVAMQTSCAGLLRHGFQRQMPMVMGKMNGGWLQHLGRGHRGWKAMGVMGSSSSSASSQQ